MNINDSDEKTSAEPENLQPIDASDTDWHQFLRETYGSLRDTPIQRWNQGDYEERESLDEV